MLRWRLLLGTLLVGTLVALFWLDYHALGPGSYLFPVALIVAFLAAGEIRRLLAFHKPGPLAWLVYGGSLLTVAAAGWPHLEKSASLQGPIGALGWPLLTFALVIVLVFACEVLRYQPMQGGMLRAALTTLAVGYAGLLLSFLVLLRCLDFNSGFQWGAAALVSVLAVVKMGDVGAYTVGRLIGRRKLCPALSPGKTVEGFLGGLLFSALTSLIFFQFVTPLMVSGQKDPTPWWAALFYGLLLGMVGVAGDLAESLMKREAGVKDSSTWMPGFGGILDLLDSLLLAAPVAYLLWTTHFVGPQSG